MIKFGRHGSGTWIDEAKDLEDFSTHVLSRTTAVEPRIVASRLAIVSQKNI